jgi:hypothetical protein
MNKKLVLQLNIPNGDNESSFAFRYIKDMYAISEHCAKNYAFATGADYYKIESPRDYLPAESKHIAYQKLKVYDLTEYDNIFYIDSDYIIKPLAPNIFNMCQNSFSACLETYPSVTKLAKRLGMPTDRYMNTGMIYFTKEVLDLTREKVLEYLKSDWEYMDQGLFNKLFFDSNIDFEKLDPAKWNPAFAGFGLYADHYAGNNKLKWGQVVY